MDRSDTRSVGLQIGPDTIPSAVSGLFLARGAADCRPERFWPSLIFFLFGMQLSRLIRRRGSCPKAEQSFAECTVVISIVGYSCLGPYCRSTR